MNTISHFRSVPLEQILLNCTHCTFKWSRYRSNPFRDNRRGCIQHLHVSIPMSSSVATATDVSYDLSMAARKLSLQPRPRLICGRGLCTLMSPLSDASATAVWRLSRELDFFRPSEGPTSCSEVPVNTRWQREFMTCLMQFNPSI